jgi:hypothetical protein
MIRVTPAPEPRSFDENVRRPGLDAVCELIGEPPSRTRPGRKRNIVAKSREDIPADEFPAFWTKAIEDLLQSYSRICAYSAFYIEPVTGAPSVDHMVAKSKAWHRVYEWDNYRLACTWMNACKGVVPDVLDPFEIQDGWFQLELVTFCIKPDPNLAEDARTRVVDTIEALKLDERECRNRRESDAQGYWEGYYSFEHLESRSPFVAKELRRQNRLRA